MKSEFLEHLTKKRVFVVGAAVLMMVAGLIHLVIVPIHWDHAPAHGLFFVLMGLAQIGWGIACWRQPSTNLYRLGIVLAGVLLTLWIITRLLPAPFEHEPAPVDLYGLICKLAEFLGIAMLVALVLAGAASSEMKLAAWRTVGTLLIVAFVGGWVTYGLGWVVEPLLPWLDGSGEHHQQHPGEHDHEQPGHAEEHQEPPASEHHHED